MESQPTDPHDEAQARMQQAFWGFAIALTQSEEGLRAMEDIISRLRGTAPVQAEPSMPRHADELARLLEMQLAQAQQGLFKPPG